MNSFNSEIKLLFKKNWYLSINFSFELVTNLQKDHNLALFHVHGEASSTDMEELVRSLQKFLEKVSIYSLCDVWDAYEFGNLYHYLSG